MLTTKRMTQVVGTVGVLSLLALSPFTVFAEAGSSSAKALRVENRTAQLSTVKSRADADIQKRLTSLNELSTKVQAMKKLAVADKTRYTTAIQADITGLTSLKAKIDADTDSTTLRTDVKSIFTTYRVYAIFEPQIRLLVAADRMTVTATELSALADKLQTRISSAGNPANLASLLSDMRVKLADANVKYAAIEAAVTSLTPANYPATTTLQAARAAIKTGETDLKAALSDAKQIRLGLPKGTALSK